MDETRPCSYSRSATLGTDHKPRHSRSVHNGEMTLLIAHETLPVVLMSIYSSLSLSIWTTTVQSSDPFLHHRRNRGSGTFFFLFLQRGKEVGDHFLQHKINDTPCSCRHVLWSDKLMWCLSTNRLGLPITAARPTHTCEHCKWIQGFFPKRKGIRADGYVDWIKVKLKINPPLIEVTTNCSGHQHAWWVEATPENQS